MKDKRNKIRKSLLLVPVVLGLAIVAAVAFLRLEGEKPEAVLSLPGAALGAGQTLSLQVRDDKSGLRRIWVGFLKDGREETIFERKFPSAGILEGGTVKEQTLKFSFEPGALDVSDGKGIIRLLVEDYSWRGWGKGNRFYKEIEVVVDTRPPEARVVSRAHYFAQGGSGLVVYGLNEDCRLSGVQVGDRFYPGYAAGFADSSLYLAFLAVAHDQPPDTPVYLVAEDYAGNRSKVNFGYRINRRRFRNDRINLPASFLKTKVPELLGIPAGSQEDLVEGFLKINRQMRKADNETIARVTSKSEGKIMWHGPFMRMPHTAPRARFADRRTYYYKGRVIDHQVHMGIDLASVARSEVPAANRGRVVLCEKLGIYGNTVIIDHGMGLFSLYAHLSRIDVSPRQMVEKGAGIGLTGRSGLAGGDHLHFSMLVNGTFVNPVQWWDPKWVENNITSKLKAYAGSKVVR